jgi:hypothetical protein
LWKRFKLRKFRPVQAAVKPAVVVALGLMLLGCGGTGASSIPHQPLYQYTCCEKAVVEQAWKVGQPFQLHWISQPAPSTNIPVPRYVVLSAQLIGPYVDVVSLKTGGPGAHTLSAPDISADTWQPLQLVSSIQLPTDLPPGLYNLSFLVAFQGGSMGGASIVQVAARQP